MLLLAIIFVILSGNNGVGVRARSLTPAPDSTVSTSPEISVLFSRPVDQDSLKNKVLISPTLPIELLWNDNRLRILPRTTLKSDTEYTVTIGPDLRDVHGIELLGQVQWQFRTRLPRIAYIHRTEERANELWISELRGKARRLSAVGQSVKAFDVSPDGMIMVYTVVEGENSENLWHVVVESGEQKRLTNESGVVYETVRFNPTGDLLAVQVRRETQIADQGTQLGRPTLELRRPTDGTPAGVIYDKANTMAQLPRWSPDGTRVAFIESQSNRIGIFNFTSEIRFFPAQAAFLWEQPWSPDGSALTYTMIDPWNPSGPPAVVVRYLTNGTETILSEPNAVRSAPAWSPTDSQIAISSQSLPTAALSSGIGLIRANGSSGNLLVSEANVIYSQPLWSKDGTWLLYGRFARAEGEKTQSIWGMQRDGSDAHLVTKAGLRAKWVP